MSDQNFPRGWGDYLSTLTPEEKESSGEWKNLGAWAARFRAARSLSNITLDGMSEDATAGYFVGLKLTLVETALETFERAASLSPGSVSIKDPDISYELWEERTNELVSALDKLENKEIRKGLQQFLDSDKDSCQKFDLRLFLKAFRHLTAHGFFNPSSSGLYTSPRYRTCLLALGDKALETCERFFLAEFQIDESPEEMWAEVELSEGPLQDHLSAFLAEENKKKSEVIKAEILEREKQQATDNVAGHALFLSRTQGLSLEIVHPQETDSGDPLRSVDAVIAQEELSKDYLVYSALMVPSEFNDGLPGRPISYKDDPEVIAEVLAQSALYITAERGWTDKSLAADLSTVGLRLERAGSAVTKLLSGWGGHMMPVLGVPVPTVVVNRAVVDYPYLLSVAGSTHHFIKIQPDVLAQLANATIVGSAAE